MNKSKNESLNNNVSPNQQNEWEALLNYDPVAAEQKLQDDLLNIDDMLEHGRITPEKAETYRREVSERAEKEKQIPLDSEAQKYLDDEMANINEMLAQGRFSEKEAEAYRAEVKQRATEDTIERARREAEEKTRFETESRARHEAEARARHEAEERARHETEEKAKALSTEESKQFTIEQDKSSTKGEAKIAGLGDESDTEYGLYNDIIDGLKGKIDQEKINRQVELEKKLDNMLPDLAELYAKNRRLVVGAKNRSEFTKLQGEYEKLLDESLRLKAEATYENGKDEIATKLENRIEELRQEIEGKLAEFVNDTPEGVKKSPESIEQEHTKLIEGAANILQSEYADMVNELEANVNAEFLNNLLEQQAKLEDATIDKLDNGTRCRKLVSKVINNKYLKGALVVAAAAGLAFTGAGLVAGAAAGTISVGLGYTAGGVALGAGRGALMGGLMSRQDSKNSAVRGFANADKIRQQLEGIDVTDQDTDTANVASWLMEQYSSANEADASSNKKRTAIAAGLGAAMGALMSGVQVDKITSEEVTKEVKTGTTPKQFEAKYFDRVDIPEGHGAYDTFTQMGGDPDDLQKALKIMHSIDHKYGLVPGSNGETAGAGGAVGNFAHTYPGPISEWPDVAQSYIEEVSKAWAKKGLIPSNTSGGEPIYDIATRVAEKRVPDAFVNFLARHVTPTIAAGATGAIVGGVGRANGVSRQTPLRSQQTPEIVSTSRDTISMPEVEALSPEADVNNFPQTELDRMSAEINATLNQEQGNFPQAELDRMSQEVNAALNQEQGNFPQAELDRMSQEVNVALNQEQGTFPQAELDRMSAEINDALSQAAEQASASEESTAQEEFRDEVINRFGDLIGEQGVNFMTSRENLNDESSIEISRWWNTLTDEAKDAVAEFEREQGDSEFGTALRSWLEIQ